MKISLVSKTIAVILKYKFSSNFLMFGKAPTTKWVVADINYTLGLSREIFTLEHMYSCNRGDNIMVELQ